MPEYVIAEQKPTATYLTPDDQTVTAFDTGPALIVPAPGNIPTAAQTAAAFLPNNGIFSPNQFSTENSQVTVTVPTVAQSAAPAAAAPDTHVPYLLFMIAAATLYLMKKRKHI